MPQNKDSDIEENILIKLLAQKPNKEDCYTCEHYIRVVNKGFICNNESPNEFNCIIVWEYKR